MSVGECHEPFQVADGRIDFPHPYCTYTMGYLTMQIRHLNCISIHQSYFPYTCSSNICCGRTSQASGTDDQDRRGLETELAYIGQYLITEAENYVKDLAFQC